jgi:D-3-phosphoglycerate dehydrogenase
MRILLTTTSYQDTPGRHHEILDNSGYDVVCVRGPLPESELLNLLEAQVAGGGGFDGLLNGDDEITARFIATAMAAPTPLRVIAKYGIGLDTIDVPYATSKRLPVLFTPGVNHTTVAEHAIGLMIAASKHFYTHLTAVKQGDWTRQTGHELAGKTLAVLGMGRVGKEVARRARAFDMAVIGFDTYWDEAFAQEYDIERCPTVEAALKCANIVSLHLPLTPETRGLIGCNIIDEMKNSVIIVNTARGGLVDEEAVADACESGNIGAYATDVLDHEPIQIPHRFQSIDNIIVTPHIGSRTFESVERQAVRATTNIVNFLSGKTDYVQANDFNCESVIRS